MPSSLQQEFFRDVALDMWRAMIANLPTPAETDFLARVFDNQPAGGRESSGCPKQLLDLACGNGRHAFALARRGFAVTGVDLSAEFISEAASRAAGQARFICADMLELPRDLAPAALFDGAYCFGNSIGHFDRGDLLRFLAGLAPLLKPGASFVVETGMAAESILPSLPKGRWFRFGDLFMLSEHNYHPREGRLDIEYTFIRHGAAVTRRLPSFVFTLAELSRLFLEAGLATVDALSTPEGAPFVAGSPRLLLLARRC